MESKVGTEKERENLYLNKPWLKFYPEGLPHEIDIPNISLIQAFDRAVEKWKNKPALIFYGKKISYLELKDQIDRFATALYGLGIRKGDTVALFLLNCPQFAIAYFGALRIGAVLTPISPVYVTPEVKHQLEDSHAETIICLDILHHFVEKTNVGLKRIILTSIDEYLPSLKKVFGKSILKAVYQKMEVPKIKIQEGKNIHWFQDLIKKSQPNPPKIEINPKEDLAALPYTGGTTGPPKGAMLTHFNIFAMQAINQTFYSYSFEKGKNLEEGKETVIAFLPFYHIYGQVVLLISGIVRGYTLVILTTPDIDDVLSSVGGYDATFFMGVPGLFELLKDYDRTGRVDWKRLKFLVSGADSLLEDTAKIWERRTGTIIHEGYGQTETSSGICVSPIGRPKMGSFGVPLPNTVVAIVHPDTAEMVPLGEIGELVVRGPQVMKGYWNRPEETGKIFLEIAGEKWLMTGDLVRMDDEGYVHFYDRKRDLIKYKGYSIFAREIEEVLKTHPKIKEAAVIGVPDPKVGANIKAVIVLEADARGKMSEEEIVSHCQEKLAHYKVPKIIEFRGEIPRTDVGKVSRRELREEREG
jgi:long-chain acyl-CoA synthetase